jgi:cytochrome c peroxidase
MTSRAHRRQAGSVGLVAPTGRWLYRRLATGRAILLAFVLMMVPALRGAGADHSIQVTVRPRAGNAELKFDGISLTNAAGQLLSVTRLDFLLSNFALHRADGAWLPISNSVAFIGARAGKTSFTFTSPGEGGFDRLRFNVGVGPELNHADAAQFPAGHPLNPSVNGLHWGWQGGFVFFALEGRWGTSDSLAGGFSYHLANDCHLMSVELPLALDSTWAAGITLGLRVEEILAGARDPRITEGNATTHSRATDTLATQLQEAVQRAFEVLSVTSTPSAASAQNPPSGQIEMAPDATPYRFAISASFPRPDLPRDNPLTEQGVELGRRLFFDPCLSRNNAQSCASCHDLKAAGSDAGKRVSLGAEGQPGTRNAMSLMNLAWKSEFFWDGRAASLREQVLQPIQNPLEMHESLTNVMAKLAHNYPPHFARAFGSPDITADRIARALEQFLLVQTSHESRFDRVLRGAAQFTEQEQRGFELFHTEYDPRREQFGADCFHCHGGPLFQSQTFANNGLDADFADPGRFTVTGKEGDRGKFAVPSLRNVEVTGPYMHDGRFATLEEVVEHYCTGVKTSAALDPNLAKHPAGGVPLAAADKQALVAFLKTLTDDRFRDAGSAISAAGTNGAEATNAPISTASTASTEAVGSPRNNTKTQTQNKKTNKT